MQSVKPSRKVWTLIILYSFNLSIYVRPNLDFLTGLKIHMHACQTLGTSFVNVIALIFVKKGILLDTINEKYGRQLDNEHVSRRNLAYHDCMLSGL